MVLVLIALASGLAALALRDGREARLDREAVRLAALLEAGRAESRASGVMVRFELASPGSNETADKAASFRFAGLLPGTLSANRWLDADTQAEIVGARALVLGPEPLIGAQAIVLRLDGQQRRVATDGLSAFAPQPVAP